MKMKSLVFLLIREESSKGKNRKILLTLDALIWASLVFVYLNPKEETSKGYGNLVYFQEVVNSQENEIKY